MEELETHARGPDRGRADHPGSRSGQSLRGLVAGLEDALLGLQRDRLKLDDFARPLNLASDTPGRCPRRTARELFVARLVEGKPPLERSARIHQGSSGARLRRAPAGTAGERGFAAHRRADPPEIPGHVRLTGTVAIDDEQFGTIKENAVRNGLITVGDRARHPVARPSLVAAHGAVVVNLYLGLASDGRARPVHGGRVQYHLGLFRCAVRRHRRRFRPSSSAFAIAPSGIGWATLAGRCTSAGARVAAPLTLAVAGDGGGILLVSADRLQRRLGTRPDRRLRHADRLRRRRVTAPARADLFARTRPGEPEPLGYTFLAPVDEYLARHRIPIIVGTALVVAPALPSLFWLHFDFNPIDLQNPKTRGDRDLSRRSSRTLRPTSTPSRCWPRPSSRPTPSLAG